ncbi:hypothetical protein [Saccharicrinis aurantiacus]|uniref:hypothetical protein n=1 Tax=Saccharicrinis aurantiacus TaxID=1849719 RepID=UPI00249063DF|nr:hypothetical protein [Saccharicrinis aurantiacus]
MTVKEQLKEYMALVAIENDKGIFELIFKNHTNDKNTLHVDKLVELVGLSQSYWHLFSTSKSTNFHYSYFKLELKYMSIYQSPSNSKNGFSTDGLKSTRVLDDLKKYKASYEGWLNAYIEEIAPGVQEKIDSIIPPNMNADDVNLLIGS